MINLPTEVLTSELAAPPTVEAVLVLKEGTAEEQVIPLRGRLRIGRTEDNDLVIHDPAVSRHHCSIHPSSAGWVVSDNGSCGGTRVDGEMALRPRLLAGGELLKIGWASLRFGLIEP